MNTDDIQKLIEAEVPDCKATVTGGEGKYEATVISTGFEGMSMVKKHQLVYSAVKAQIASGEVHALSIKTFTPEEWDAQNLE